MPTNEHVGVRSLRGRGTRSAAQTQPGPEERRKVRQKLSHINQFGAIAKVPEPGTLSLFDAGLIPLGFMRRRAAA